MNLDSVSYLAVRHQQLGPLSIEQWAADGALALFFFIAGLELKREIVLGSLRRPADAAVPVVAAICGVAVPALMYVAVDQGTANLRGWAIPAATDIAFALAILAVVGSALPSNLRAFLLTLAVVDDLIVIAIIAVFYSDTISVLPLLGAAAAFAAYAVCQRLRVRTFIVYVPVALLGWALLHASGVHATVAGIALGLLTRVRPDEDEARSPAETLEHRLAPVSSWLAVPFFALMSAGVSLNGLGGALLHPLALGIAAGLVLGKPIGILGGTWLATRSTGADLAPGVTWRDLVGVAILGGVGFTVSLLVSDLSFGDQRAEVAKAAVLAASVVAAVLGALFIGRRNRHHRRA
jgi:NhaA family Na+:H+ antiporter